MKSIKRSLLLATAIAVASSNAAQAEDVPEANRSKNFEAVSAHLDLGGDIYAYVDVDGDAEKLATIFQGFIDSAKAQAGGDIPPQVAMLKLTDLSSDLGISSIGALGMSSYKNGETYRNKYYLHLPGGRTGFVKVFGGDAAPFAVQELAPAGSDLVMEQDIDLKSAFELVGSLALKYGGAEAAAELLKAAREPIGPGLTMAEIFAHLDTKVVVVGQVHPDKPLALPEEVPFKIPGFDLFMSVDGFGPIFTKVIATMPADQRPQLLVEGPGFQQINIPVPPEMAGMMSPVIRHELGSGRVIFATSAAYVDKCVSAATTVWDDATFKEAMTDLPEEGNALSFVSGEFMGEYLRVYADILKTASAEGGMPLGMGEMMIGLLKEFGLSPDHSQGHVMVNLPDGILIVENSGASAKQSIAAVGGAFMAGMAGVFTFSQAEMPPAPFEESREFPPGAAEEFKAPQIPKQIPR